MKSRASVASLFVHSGCWLVALCLAGAACSDEATIIDLGAAPAPAAPSEPQQPTPAGPELGPVYAFQSVVYNPDDSTTTYVALSDSLDFSSLSLQSAREFPSYAFITVVDGKLLVSHGEEPVISRYEITPDLGWRELDRVSFANQGVTGSGAGFERQWFVSETAAYVTLDITRRVIWNPSTMLIDGVAEDSALELTRDGLVLDAAFNRQARILGGPVLKPFYYRDENWYRFGPTTPVAVYDPVTHAERGIIEVPCPGLEVSSRDEAGNTYFSAWTYGPLLGMFGEGPELCVRRIAPDSTLDESWAPDLDSWTGGRPVMVFRYMRDGKAIGTVLHSDEVEVDYAAGYNDDVATELAGHFKLWLFDLDSQSAKPIVGIDRIDSGFFSAIIDGRSFVFAPYEDWSRSKVYELDAEGNATEVLDTTGFAYDMIRVR